MSSLAALLIALLLIGALLAIAAVLVGVAWWAVLGLSVLVLAAISVVLRRRLRRSREVARTES